MNPADRPAPVPVAIIGMGCLFPGSNDLHRYWASIRDGVDAIREVPSTHWNPEDLYDADPKAPDRTYARRGGFLDPVDFPSLDFGIAPANLDATDTTQLLGLMVAKAALDDAGYGAGSEKALDRERVSVVLGVTGALELVVPLGARLGHPIWRRALKEAGVAEPVASDVVQRIGDSYVGWQENSFPGLLGNVAAGRIANRLDLGGTNCVVDAACASTMGALHLALMELAAGKCDLALTGGLDTFNDIFMYMCFSKTPALSPTGDARPFAAGGDGTALGEGLGILTLKRLDDARRDGDRIYAVIKGVGSSSDGKGNAVYAPSSAGQAKCLRRAYENAGVSPRTVELVEAHGTGTKVGDAVELRALAEVFGSAEGAGDGSWCALGSVKSQIGHTKAAAGAAGLIKAALALYHKVLPPTIKVDRPADLAMPGASPFYLNTEARPWLPRPDHPRRAAVSAFGFGGTNFHCVLEEADPAPAPMAWDGDDQIVAFSGADPGAILAKLDGWPAGLAWDAFRVEAARSREQYRAADPCRLTIAAAREGVAWPKLVDRAKALLAGPAGNAPEGVYYATGAEPGGLAVLFPGQGSQRVGMLRDLACRFPTMLEALASASEGGDDLADRIYPQPSWDDESRAHAEAALRATDVAQPALGAVEIGAYRVLEGFGIRPGAFAGHSFGELAALHASGRIDARSFRDLARLRGRLMAGDGGDLGSMLAVMATVAEIESILREDGLDLVVANRNAPRQSVLSGDSAEIARAVEAFGRRGISSRSLGVAAAFHSPLVADASAPLLRALAAVEFVPASAPVYANATASPYPDSADVARTLLAEQLALPVRFVEQVEAMARAGIRTFVEVGPDSKLTSLVDAILEGQAHSALALDASRGERPGMADLGRLIAHLAALGHPIRLDRWDEGVVTSTSAASKPGLTVKVSGANFAPKPKPRAAAIAAPQPGPVPAPPTREPSATMKPLPTARPTPRPIEAPGPRPAAPNGPARHESNGHVVPALALDPTRPNASILAEALRASQENLVALQRLAEQTSNLHRLYLDGQDRATQTFQSLLDHHQRLTLATLGMAPAMPRALPTSLVAPVPAPAPPSLAVPAVPPRPSEPARRTTPTAPAPRPTVQAVAEPAPAPPAIPTPPPAAVQGSAASKVHAALVEVVSEKTGYPAEVLEPSMQLDADLGIDSIKRVEILAALQERLPASPVIGPEHLGTIRTLGQIVEFLAEGPSGIPEPKVAATASTPAAAIHAALVEVVSEKTGYPAEVLEPSMQLDADLGIDSIKRVEILAALQERLPASPVIGPEHLGTIRTLGQIVEFLAGTVRETPEVKPVAAAAKVAPADPAVRLEPVRRFVPSAIPIGPGVESEPIPIAGGEVWVLDDGSDLARAIVERLGSKGLRGILVDRAAAGSPGRAEAVAGLVLLADGGEVGDAFRHLRAAAPGLRKAGGAFATVTRLGGAFGLDGVADGVDPTSGALAGMAKTAGHEWPEVACKAIDLDPTLATAEAASAVVSELFRRGPAEVGISASGRSGIRVANAPVGPASGTDSLAKGDVVVITGGARGVTADVAEALAGAFRPTIALLGRSPAPSVEPEWLAPLSGEAEIKRALHGRASGPIAPQALGEQYKEIAANREVLANLRRIEAAGARVVYRSVDVRDREALASVVGSIRRDFGPIRGLIHGAGVLADRRIEDQSDEQFARVFETKVAGIHGLLEAIGGDDLKVMVLFSSTTARLGRVGQVAYASANEALNKRAQVEAATRPGCKVLSINWGPWDGGMVTPSLRSVFEAEGVALIPPAEGARYLVEELRAGPGGPVEVVVLGGGGPEPTFFDRAEPPDSEDAPASAMATIFERPLEAASLPILRSHVMDGRPVLPMALVLEWLAQGAMSRHPGLVYQGLNDLRLLKGVVLRDGHPETIRVLAGKAIRADGRSLVPVELRGILADGREVLHARGEVVLGDRHPTGERPGDEPSLPAYSLDAREIYRDILFHGPGLQGIVEVEGCGDAGIAATVASAPPPASWVDRPNRQQWLADPMVLDCAFQLMILWSVERTGSGSLPTFVGSYRQFRRGFPASGVRVVSRITESGPHKARADVDFLDAQGEPIARIEDYECVIDASLRSAFRRNRAAAESK